MKTRVLLAVVQLAAACGGDGPTGAGDIPVANAPWATGRIAYSVQTPGKDSELYLMDVATRRVDRIATAPPADFFGLSWTGGTIVFFSFPSNAEAWQVSGIEPDGRNRRRLFPSDRHSWFSAVSKQGRVAYLYNGLPEFKGTAIDGRPAFPGTTETRPAWSPDGRTMLVAMPAIGTPSRLLEIDVTTLPAKILKTVFTSPSVDRRCLAPIYSPDGRRVAFTLAISARSPGERVVQEIWVIDADGSNARAVTGGAIDDHAAWSPDGTMLAFTRASAEAPRSRLHVIRIDGTELAPLFDHEAHDPVWAP